MSTRYRLITSVAVALVLFQAAADQGIATVIRDGKTGPVNPAVEAGGQPISMKDYDQRTQSNVPYSLIGALRPEDGCLYPYFGWAWNMFRSFGWRHRVAEPKFIGVPASPVNGPINRPLRP